MDPRAPQAVKGPHSEVRIRVQADVTDRTTIGAWETFTISFATQ